VLHGSEKPSDNVQFQLWRCVGWDIAAELAVENVPRRLQLRAHRKRLRLTAHRNEIKM
jgi:hypothetical protein